jgi:hypothetical protein
VEWKKSHLALRCLHHRFISFFGQKPLDRLAFALIDGGRQQVLKPPDIYVARRFIHEQPPMVMETTDPLLFKAVSVQLPR